MTQFRFHLFLAASLLIVFGSSLLAAPNVQAQEPTPTSALEATGMYITVISTEPQINVRMGPSSIVYPIVGYLLPGQTAPALGRSPGGDWIQISYPGAPYEAGWVYAPLVQVSPGVLRIIEPPPTPVPPATPTIDPALLAQFTYIPTATRLATFTPPPALNLPSYTEIPQQEPAYPIPWIVIFFGSTGFVGLIFSFLSRK